MRATHGTVYRAVAANGTVLYVGMTTRLGERIREHANGSGWWAFYQRIERDRPLPLDEAFRSEADQIELFRPVFNRIAGVVDRYGPDRTTEREWLGWKARYEAGETVEEIALDVHAGTHTVRKRLVALGTEMRRPGQRQGIVHRNRADAPAPVSDAVVHVAFAGARTAHRRRGGRRRAAA